MRIAWLMILGAGVLLEAAGDVLFKQAAVSNRQVFFIIGFAIYALGSLLWAYSLRYNLLSKSIVIFMVLNVIFVVVAGVALFKEELTATSWLGILLGVVSIILLEL